MIKNTVVENSGSELKTVDSATIQELQESKTFRDLADGDEFLRQRLIAFAIAKAERALDPDNPVRIQAEIDLGFVCKEFYVAPIYGTGQLQFDAGRLDQIGQLAN